MNDKTKSWPNDKRKDAILGVILAGGASSRMGHADKFLMPLGDKIILQHIIDRARPQVDDLLLNINEPVDRVKGFSLKTISDILPKSSGPLSGIYTAMHYAKTLGYSMVVTFACDTPFVPDNFVCELLKKSDGPVVVAKSGNQRHPIMSLWHVSLMDDLKKALEKGEYKLLKWIDPYNPAEVVWNENPDPFYNINTGEDLKKAEELYTLI